MISLPKPNKLQKIFISTIGTLSVLPLVAMGFALTQPRTSVQINNPVSSASLVAVSPVQPSKQTTVSPAVVAEKLDLQRKVIEANSTSQIAQIKSLIEKQGGQFVSSHQTTIVAHLPKENEPTLLQTLKQNNAIKHIEVDYPVFLSADTQDWGVQKIQAPAVWTTTQAAGVKVAVIDTGIDYTHPDLAARYVGGYDTVNEDSDPRDDNGHGTHVSGIIASDANNAGRIGVSPQANILAIKSLAADGSGYLSDIIQGIDWAMANGAQVINLSLGTTYNSSTLESKINQAIAKGIIVVAAAGNENGAPLLYPAAYTSVISVAATDSSDRFASFSNLGAELVAPGVAISSAIPGGSYASWSGTSMATPHVSATVALMIANKQTNIRQRLRETAIDLGSSGVDAQFGYGLIDAKAAVLGADTLAPIVTFTSPHHNANVSDIVPVSVSAQDENQILNISLLINNQIIVRSLQSPLTFEWNTATYPAGSYELIAQATDNSNNLGQAKITVSRTLTSSSPTSSPTPKVTTTPKNHQSTNTNKQKGKSTPTPTASSSAQINSETAITTPDNTDTIPTITNSHQRNQTPQPANNHSNSQGKIKSEVKGISTSFWQELLKKMFLFN